MTVMASRVRAHVHAAQIAGSVSPTDRTTLWDLEGRFWTGGADFARSKTARNAIMILPYPPGILQGDHIWSHLPQRTGWRSVKMRERRVMRYGDIAILTYGVSAEKSDLPLHKALCASTYVNSDGDWLRICHQETPLA